MALQIRFNAQQGIIVARLELISIRNVRAELIALLVLHLRRNAQSVHTVLKIPRISLKQLNVLDANRELIKTLKETQHASHAQLDISVWVAQYQQLLLIKLFIKEKYVQKVSIAPKAHSNQKLAHKVHISQNKPKALLQIALYVLSILSQIKMANTNANHVVVMLLI